MAKIGILDSGIGGIAVLKKVMEELPLNEYIYYADNKNIPYGDKSKEEITRNVDSIVQKLINMECDMIILACNTATTASIAYLRNKYDKVFVGTEPPILPALRKGGNKILCIATPFTVKSDKYSNLVSGKQNVLSLSCKDLASKIEKHFPNIMYFKKDVHVMSARYSNYDSIVLGCTHYILIKNMFIEQFKYAKVYDSCAGIVKRVKAIMAEYKLGNNKFKVEFCFTGQDERKRYLTILDKLLSFKI